MNCGTTASTVKSSAGAVYVVVGPVPVTVMVYSVFVLVALVVIVAVALPGADTAVGLTVHTGVSVVVIADDTWQPSETVPVKPFTDPIWILVDETPPGATAAGDNADGCSVNSEVPCPSAAAPSIRRAANKHPARRVPRASFVFNVDSVRLVLDMKKFDMNRLYFNYLRFLGSQKSCPPHRTRALLLTSSQ